MGLPETIRDMLREGHTKTDIAASLGCSRNTVIRHASGVKTVRSAADAVKSDIGRASDRDRLRDSEEKYRVLLAEHAALQKLHKSALGLIDDWRPVEAVKPRGKGSGSESTALLIASDWHSEEVVDPGTVSGLNAYSPEIARKRAESFWQHGLQLTEMARSRGRVGTAVVGLLGDFISGYIHDELVEVNAMSPTQAIVFAGEMIEGGLRMLLDHGKFNRIIAICCVGNHGRTTHKRRVATNIQNSYEWLLYYMLQRQLPEIEWQLPTGYHNWLQVYDTRIRLHHGESVRYQGGVGGMTIPLNKAIAQWNRARPADLDILGHWHQRISTREAIVNGSLIGYSPFSVEIKAAYEPPAQAFALIHQRYGKTVEAPIFVDGGK